MSELERDYRQELNALKNQMEEMRFMLSQLTNAQQSGNKNSTQNTTIHVKEEKNTEKNVQPMRNMHPDTRLSALMDEITEEMNISGVSGLLTYLGAFASGGRQSNWIRNKVVADNLLTLIESIAAAKVLACIGSNERLNILLALLRSPRTVAQLVEQCGFNTTGQIYHHLRPLIAADLVTEDEKARGTYIIQPHRVQGFIMLLAGISDMLDPTYTKGNWDELPEIGIYFGSRFIPEIVNSSNSVLVPGLVNLRQCIAQQTGTILPVIRVRDDLVIPENEIHFKADGILLRRIDLGSDTIATRLDDILAAARLEFVPLIERHLSGSIALNKTEHPKDEWGNDADSTVYFHLGIKVEKDIFTNQPAVMERIFKQIIMFGAHMTPDRMGVMMVHDEKIGETEVFLKFRDVVYWQRDIGDEPLGDYADEIVSATKSYITRIVTGGDAAQDAAIAQVNTGKAADTTLYLRLGKKLERNISANKSEKEKLEETKSTILLLCTQLAPDKIKNLNIECDEKIGETELLLQYLDDVFWKYDAGDNPLRTYYDEIITAVLQYLLQMLTSGDAAKDAAFAQVDKVSEADTTIYLRMGKELVKNTSVDQEEKELLDGTIKYVIMMTKAFTPEKIKNVIMVSDEKLGEKEAVLQYLDDVIWKCNAGNTPFSEYRGDLIHTTLNYLVKMMQDDDTVQEQVFSQGNWDFELKLSLLLGKKHLQQLETENTNPVTISAFNNGMTRLNRQLRKEINAELPFTEIRRGQTLLPTEIALSANGIILCKMDLGGDTLLSRIDEVINAAKLLFVPQLTGQGMRDPLIAMRKNELSLEIRLGPRFMRDINDEKAKNLDLIPFVEYVNVMLRLRRRVNQDCGVDLPAIGVCEGAGLSDNEIALTANGEIVARVDLGDGAFLDRIEEVLDAIKKHFVPLVLADGAARVEN